MFRLLFLHRLSIMVMLNIVQIAVMYCMHRSEEIRKLAYIFSLRESKFFTTKRARNALIRILYWFKFKILRKKSKLAWKRRIKRKQQSGRHSFDSNALTRTSQMELLVHSHTFLSSVKAHNLISRIVCILTRMFLRHILRKRASRSTRSLKIL